jgi:hypothetical protein
MEGTRKRGKPRKRRTDEIEEHPEIMGIRKGKHWRQTGRLDPQWTVGLQKEVRNEKKLHNQESHLVTASDMSPS